MCLSIDFIVPLSLSYQFISTVQLLCRLNWDFALLHLGTLTYVLWHALNQFYAAIDFSALLSSELAHTYINQYIKTFCFHSAFCFLFQLLPWPSECWKWLWELFVSIFHLQTCFLPMRGMWHILQDAHTADQLVFVYNSPCPGLRYTRAQWSMWLLCTVETDYIKIPSFFFFFFYYN